MSSVAECLCFFPTQDVLHNDNLKLDWMFQLSIAFDVARVSITHRFNVSFSKDRLCNTITTVIVSKNI